MGKRKKELEETQDMSMTFIAEVGQKSAVAEDKLDDISGAIDIKKNPPTNEEFEDFGAIYNDKNKPNKKGIMITLILMILCFMIGFGSSKFFFDEKSNKKQLQNQKTEKSQKDSSDEVFSSDSLFVKNLISRYNYQYFDNYVYETLYSKEKIIVEDIKEDYLQMLTAIQATKNPVKVHFTSEEFQNALTLLFGNQVVLDNKDISFDKCNKVVFDEKFNTYSLDLKNGCEVSNSLVMKSEIVSVQKEDDTLKVDVAIAIIDENADKVYKKYDVESQKGEEELENMDASDFDISSNYADLDQYQYLFHYDKNNNNYYLKQIEFIQ